MKRKILKISVISALALAVIIPVSIAAASGNLDFWSEDKTAERQDIEKTYTVDLAGKDKFTVSYDMSRASGEDIADIYKDARGNDYIYKNGKLTGFYSNEIKNPATDCEPIGKENAEKIAVNFISDFTDNVKEYSLSSFEEKENYGQYYLTYARKLGEIFTDEYVKISVMYDGAVKSVTVNNDGKYENVSDDIVEGLNEASLCDFAEAELKTIYPDADSKFEMRKYSFVSEGDDSYISILGDFNGLTEQVRYYIEG